MVVILCGAEVWGVVGAEALVVTDAAGTQNLSTPAPTHFPLFIVGAATDALSVMPGHICFNAVVVIVDMLRARTFA